MENKVLRFLALGDSYTIGEGVDPSERWPIQLVARLRQQGFPIDAPTIIARTGWSTAELAAAVETESPAGEFQLVTLLVGVIMFLLGVLKLGSVIRFVSLALRWRSWL